MARTQQRSIDATVIRVGVIRSGAILAERLVRGRDITVGRAADNLIRLEGPDTPASCTIVSWKRRHAPALRTGVADDGRVSASGDAAPVRLADAPDRLALAPGARVRLSWGATTVLLQCLSRPAPAPASRSRGLEWPILAALLISFFVLGGSGAGLDVWWRVTGRYYDGRMEQARKGHHLDTIRVAARVEAKPPTPSQPPPEPSPIEEVAAEVETASPTPAPAIVPPARRSPPRRVTPREKRPRATRDAVARGTFLRAINGQAGPGGMLAAATHSARDATAFEGLGGIVTTERATPTGPAAASDTRYRELDPQVRAKRAIATGQVRTQKKTDRDERRIKVRLTPGKPSTPTGAGTLDPQAITRVFSRRKGAVSSCYERLLLRHPDASGRIKLRFTIGSAGRITAISAVQNTIGHDSVATCIIDKVRGWRFDPPRGGDVTFAYPFLLERAGASISAQ